MNGGACRELELPRGMARGGERWRVQEIWVRTFNQRSHSFICGLSLVLRLPKLIMLRVSVHESTEDAEQCSDYLIGEEQRRKTGEARNA